MERSRSGKNDAETVPQHAKCTERETNHDAVPEAKAFSSESSVPLGNGGGCDGTDKPATLPAVGTGDILGVDSPQPFIAAYAVYLNGEYDSSYGPDAIDEALEIAAECNGEVVPLYRTPQTHATPGDGSVQSEGTSPKSYQNNDKKRVLSDMKNAPDIVTRLRRWCHAVDAESAQDLMDEAAADIERLRLRRHEREAIEAAAESVKLDDDSNWTTLIELLERTK